MGNSAPAMCPQRAEDWSSAAHALARKDLPPQHTPCIAGPFPLPMHVLKRQLSGETCLCKHEDLPEFGSQVPMLKKMDIEAHVYNLRAGKIETGRSPGLGEPQVQ